MSESAEERIDELIVYIHRLEHEILSVESEIENGIGDTFCVFCGAGLAWCDKGEFVHYLTVFGWN